MRYAWFGFALLLTALAVSVLLYRAGPEEVTETHKVPQQRVCAQYGSADMPGSKVRSYGFRCLRYEWTDESRVTREANVWERISGALTG